MPVWSYQVRDLILEKRILLLHEQNTVHVCYQVSGNGAAPAARAAAGV